MKPESQKPTRKHIVIDARESGTSTGTYLDNLVKYLHKLQPPFKVTLLAKKRRLNYLREIAPNFEVIETPFAEFTFGEQLGFKKQIKRLHADLVHFTMVQQPVFYRGNVVTTMHDLTGTRFRNPTKNWLVFTLKQQVYKWVNKRAARKSTTVITPTNFVKQDVARYAGIPKNKIVVTYEAADKITDAAKPIHSVEGEQYIMYVGRPQPHKNLRALIDAYKILRIDHPDLKLVLVGKKDGAYKQLAEYAHRIGVDNIVFTGWISEGQKRWLYEHTAAYVFTSLSEGFGLPPLEAMINGGAPVASSDATCLPELYGDAVLYFDPKNTNDIAKKVSQILSDKSLANQLSKKGLRLAQTFSWQRMAEQTLSVYKKALGE